MKLTYKIMIPIILVLGFLLVIVLFFTQQSLKDALMKEEFFKVRETIIKRMTFLLSGDDFNDPFHPISQSKFQDFANDIITPSIDRLTIWDRNNTIIFSTMKSLVGYKYPAHNDIRRLFAQKKAFFLLKIEDLNEPVYYAADEFLDIYIPVRISGELFGAVEVHLVMAATLLSLATQSRNLSIMLILSGVLILVAVWAVIRLFILKPIRILEQAAEYIRKDDFNHQLSGWASDEIGGLTENFNAMRLVLKKNTTALKKEKNTVQKYNKKLSLTINDLNNTQLALEGAVSDLKEAKQKVEDKVKERTKELNYEKEKLDNIAQNMDLGALLLNKDQKVLFINKAAKTILGISGSQEKNVLKIFIKKFSQFNIQDYLNKCMTGEYSEIQEAESDGEVYRISFHGSSSLDYGKNLFCHFVWIRNITQEKLLERSKIEFVAIASHQLRTPLTVTKGNVEMLLDKTFGKLNKEQLDILEQTSAANERLIHLVNDMLDISKIEKGSFELKLKPVHLDVIARAVVDDLKDYAIKHGVKIKYKKIKDIIPLVLADELRIRQVFQNLIDNAIRYSKDKKSNPSLVEISFCIGDDRVEVSVSDNGIGIPKQEQGKIFQRFYRASNAVIFSSDGTGLGLYMVKAVIEKFGGVVYFVSKENEGTVFTFALPIVKI